MPGLKPGIAMRKSPAKPEETGAGTFESRNQRKLPGARRTGKNRRGLMPGTEVRDSPLVLRKCVTKSSSLELSGDLQKDPSHMNRRR